MKCTTQERQISAPIDGKETRICVPPEYYGRTFLVDISGGSLISVQLQSTNITGTGASIEVKEGNSMQKERHVSLSTPLIIPVPDANGSSEVAQFQSYATAISFDLIGSISDTPGAKLEIVIVQKR